MLTDDLDYISIEQQTTDFPKHFHETFCISLIYKGIEQINFENQSFFSEKGSLSITNPYEIHSNPLIDKDSCLKFDTIYLSNDLMRYLLNGKNITFLNRKINCEKAYRLFIKLKNAMDAGHSKSIELFLKQFANTLQYHSQECKKEYDMHHFHGFDEINRYIENHISEKFCLAELSKRANINKYGFVKKFKASTGMTPMNFIMMKKIFSCKNLIDSNSELTEIAYQYNFSDLSHFSKTFKRYIGISPKRFQESRIEIS